MIITCPECDTSYSVDDNVIPSKGRKVQCASCGNTWVSNPAPKEASKETSLKDEYAALKSTSAPESSKAVNLSSDADKVAEALGLDTNSTSKEDVNYIFSRLSTIKDDFEEVRSQDVVVTSKRFSFSKLLSGLFTVLIILCCIGFFLYYFRYDVVNIYPASEKIYKQLNISTSVVGEGLEFTEVSKSDYKDGHKEYFIINGFISNTTASFISLPDVTVKLIDEHDNVVSSSSYTLSREEVAPYGKVAFSIPREKPNMFIKSIMLTFTE